MMFGRAIITIFEPHGDAGARSRALAASGFEPRRPGIIGKGVPCRSRGDGILQHQRPPPVSRGALWGGLYAAVPLVGVVLLGPLAAIEGAPARRSPGGLRN